MHINSQPRYDAMQICCQRIFGKRRHSGYLEGKSQLKSGYFVYSFAGLAAGMRFKRQNERVNHRGNRLRSEFNENLCRETVKSRPDGQNLHYCNRKRAHIIDFLKVYIEFTMKTSK